MTNTGQGIASKLPMIIAAMVVFFIGRWISARIANNTKDAMNRAPNSDKSVSRFMSSIVRYVLLLATILVVLRILKIDTSAVSGMVLGLGAALAFILKDALADVASGVMLLLFRPYNVGDEVEIGGKKGVVSSIDILATQMTTRDNIAIVVQNSKAWGGVIRNHNAMGKRRLDTVFGVSYDANIDTAIAAILAAAAKDERIEQDPAPWAKVVSLGESSVDIELRAWCDYNDHRKIKMDISQAVKAELAAAGVGIPYPHEVKIKQKVNASKARDRVAKLTKLRNS